MLRREHSTLGNAKFQAINEGKYTLSLAVPLKCLLVIRKQISSVETENILQSRYRHLSAQRAEKHKKIFKNIP